MKQEEPKQHVEFINNNIDQLDKAIESFKQETLEEAAERILFENTKNVEIRYRGSRDMVIKSMLDIAKWQQEQDKNKYSEEEVIHIVQRLMYDVHCGGICEGDKLIDFKISPIQWFEQFKNK